MFLKPQWGYFMEGWGRQYRGKASYGCWIVSLVIWNWYHVLKRYRMLVPQEPRRGASEKWIFCTPFGEKVHGTNRLSSQTQLGYFKLLHQTTHCHNNYEGWDLQRCHQPFHTHLCCSVDSKMSLAFPLIHLNSLRNLWYLTLAALTLIEKGITLSVTSVIL